MASKTRKATPSRSTSASAASLPISSSFASAPSGAAGFALAQEQLQSLIALADVIFKSAEELRRWQLESVQEVRRRHERANADVVAAASPTELLHVQSELLRGDLESAGQYWQRLATIFTTAQAEAVGLIGRNAASLGQATAATAPVVPATVALPAAESVEALDPSQAWNRWVDLGKQWSDMLYRNEAALH